MATVVPGRDYSWLDNMVKMAQIATEDRRTEIMEGINAYDAKRSALDREGMAQALNKIEGKGFMSKWFGDTAVGKVLFGSYNRPNEIVNPDYDVRAATKAGAEVAYREIEKQGGWMTPEAQSKIGQEMGSKTYMTEERGFTPEKYEESSYTPPFSYEKALRDANPPWQGAQYQKMERVTRAIDKEQDLKGRQMFSDWETGRREAFDTARREATEVGEISKESLARDEISRGISANLGQKYDFELKKLAGSKYYEGTGSEQLQQIFDRYQKSGEADQFAKSVTEWGRIYGVDPTDLLRYTTAPKGKGTGAGKEALYDVYDANGNRIGQIGSSTENPNALSRTFLSDPRYKAKYGKVDPASLTFTKASDQPTPKVDRDVIKREEMALNKMVDDRDTILTPRSTAIKQVEKYVIDNGLPYRLVGDKFVYTGGQGPRLGAGAVAAEEVPEEEDEGGGKPPKYLRDGDSRGSRDLNRAKNEKQLAEERKEREKKKFAGMTEEQIRAAKSGEFVGRQIIGWLEGMKKYQRTASSNMR